MARDHNFARIAHRLIIAMASFLFFWSSDMMRPNLDQDFYLPVLATLVLDRKQLWQTPAKALTVVCSQFLQ